ncbi:hypothetical protein ACFL1R_05895 [Candidatus Latescibacterota bacterium]
MDRETIINNKFNGLWTGEGKIIVTWSEKKYISFELLIDENGNVNGTIGDAIIHNGKLKHNNIIYRLLGNKDYIIDVKLSNFLIEKEKIKRESIRIFLDFKNPFFIGGFHSSGSIFGGKEKMKFSGTKIKLSKN